ncbi:Double C2-like domain-containing protein alpha [Labeo rohita]|uniref:Double C2-like domain-containing protein alpha n=1 Tax=Labeo rohita TaxID=84645 RepID=A0ABQ8MU96_LABRO|nr:Double C2-like domain-containing protein alpha [Labeo rohita]
MTVRKGKKLTISIQEHMAIDVCPGPIRPIRQISAYFPRLSPTAEPISPNPASPLALSPGVGASGGTSGGLLSPLQAGARGGGGTLSAASSIETSVDICSSDSDDSTALGTLEFELRYERATSSLHCTIIRAKGLKPMDFNGLADPYTLTYIGITEEDMHRKTLRLSVCDEDKLTHNEFIGESRVALRRVKPDQTKRFYTCLEHPPPLPSPTAMGAALRGISCYLREINGKFERTEAAEHFAAHLKATEISGDQNNNIFKGSEEIMWFLPPPAEGEAEGRRGGLYVGVLRCAHLAAMDVNGFSDPYVKTYLKPDVKKKSKHKTAVIKKTLNPEFNEVWMCLTNCRGARHAHFITRGVCLSCHVQGDALRHWMDCLRNKGQKLERWHILTNELPQTTCHD